jgi:hypothetical protein
MYAWVFVWSLTFRFLDWNSAGTSYRLSVQTYFKSWNHESIAVFVQGFIRFKERNHHHHHHMAVQPKSGPGLPFWGFVTIAILRSWIVSPAPNPQPGGSGLGIYNPPGDRVSQLYPQALGTHFSRLLQAWVTMGLFFNPGHHTGLKKGIFVSNLFLWCFAEFYFLVFV